MTPGTEVSLCTGYKGSDEIQVKSCSPGKCTSGLNMVDDVTEKALRAGVDDNLFLSRYARAVTLNGEIINDKDDNDKEMIGYGAWRLTKEQFETVLRGSKSQVHTGSISNNFSSNYEVRPTKLNFKGQKLNF